MLTKIIFSSAQNYDVSISLTFCCTLKLFGNSLYTILSYLFSFILFIQYRINQTKQWHPTPVLLPGESHGRGAWWAAVHGVAKSQTWLRDFTFTFHLHALEKEMAPHSITLAWENPRDGGAQWAAIYGAAQIRTWLKRLSSSSSSRYYYSYTPYHKVVKQVYSNKN